MKEHESFSSSIYEEQMHQEELEMYLFICAVTEVFGPVQAEFASEAWLEEADLIDAPPLSNSRNWRSVTMAAAARLSNPIDATEPPPNFSTSYSDTRVSPIPSSNCSAILRVMS